jgi:hypothetical protein
MSMTEMSAQGRSASVFARRFHRGSGTSSGVTAEGMALNCEKEEFEEYKYCKEGIVASLAGFRKTLSPKWGKVRMTI